MNTLVHSHLAAQVIALGISNHRHYRVVWHGEVPTQPKYMNGGWIEVLKSDSIIPKEASRRIKEIRQTVGVKEVLVWHEAPKLLEGPKKPPKPNIVVNTAVNIAPYVLEAAKLVAGAVAGLLWLFGVLMMGVLADPAVIVVLEDGTWVEVAAWYE